MDKETDRRFAEAVERKNEQARERSQQRGEQNPTKPDLHGDQHIAERETSTRGHGQVTADKWNQ